MRKLDTFRGDSTFTTWLHRVTVNAALAHRRKSAARPEVNAADPIDNFLDNGRNLLPSRPLALRPEQAAIDKESQGLIEAAIADIDRILHTRPPWPRPDTARVETPSNEATTTARPTHRNEQHDRGGIRR